MVFIRIHSDFDFLLDLDGVIFKHLTMEFNEGALVY